jgi:hypothetical protein
MTAEMISPVPWARPPVSRRRGPRTRPVAGVLDDGTPFYAPIGEVATDGTLVVCHPCGRSLRSVTAHLRVHGWTKTAYCETFGLERGQSLEGPETRKMRAGPDGARRQAPRRSRTRGAGRRAPRLRQHRRVRHLPQSRGLDLAGHVRRIRAATDVAAPARRLTRGARGPEASLGAGTPMIELGDDNHGA